MLVNCASVNLIWFPFLLRAPVHLIWAQEDKGTNLMRQANMQTFSTMNINMHTNKKSKYSNNPLETRGAMVSMSAFLPYLQC